MSTPVTTSYVTPSATATPTSSANSADKNSSNPLLFFVALGFGVLFTNLWIIIGVKYCFRYQNARRRGLTLNGGIDGVALGTVHHGRRRREKKLMTMEEVETQFPQMTYKAWRAQRERMGLSTEGGVEVVGQEEAQTAREVLSGRPASRAASVRSVRSRSGSMSSIYPIKTNRTGVYDVGKNDLHVEHTPLASDSITPAEKGSLSASSPSKRVSLAIEHEIPNPLDSPRRKSIVANPTVGSPLAPADPVDAELDATADERGQDEAEIEHLPQDIGSGDTCAICIDQLEEEDEIRGLTCGHAFHCSCVDVWLTTRRAICPLCKKDYWVRKTPAADPTMTTAGTDLTDQVHGTRTELAASVDPIVVNPFRAGFWRVPRRLGGGASPLQAPTVNRARDLEHGTGRMQGHPF